MADYSVPKVTIDLAEYQELQKQANTDWKWVSESVLVTIFNMTGSYGYLHLAQQLMASLKQQGIIVTVPNLHALVISGLQQSDINITLVSDTINNTTG